MSHQQLFDQFHEVMATNPMGLTMRDDFSRAAELPVISDDAKWHEAAFQMDLAGRIEDFDASSLPFSTQLDLELAGHTLRAAALDDFIHVGEAARYQVRPMAMQDFGETTARILTNDPRPKGEIVETLVARMEGLDEFLRGQVNVLQRPVSLFRELELAAAREFPGLAEGVARFASSVGYKNMGRVHTAIDNATFRVGSYHGQLDQMSTREDFSVGPEAAAKWFLHKGVTVPVPEIYAIAQNYMVNLRDTLEEMKPTLVEKYDLDSSMTIQQVAAALKEKFASPKGRVVEFAQEQAARAEQFAVDLGLATKLDDAVYQIVSCLEYMKPLVPVAAILSTGSFAKGKRINTVYINEIDGVEKGLNRLNLPAIMSHELSPGHGYQLTKATEHPSIVRAWTRPMETAEGWTTYVAEEVMASYGFCGDPALRDEEEFAQGMDLLRLGGRVCFVLAGLTGDRKYLTDNAMGVPVTADNLFDAQVELYQGITGFVPARARGDVSVFNSEGTYGALYLVGNHLLRSMNMKCMAKGSGMDQFDFFERVITEGNLPLSYMERQFKHDGVL